MSVELADVRCNAIINEIYSDPKVGVEVGVLDGRLSWRLLGSNRNLFLYMVDPWSDVVATDSYLSTDDYVARMDNTGHEDNMRKALDAVSMFKGQYEVIRAASENASGRFGDGTLDFVFIDADHSYAGCRKDILLWYPKVRRGGLLCGHDYRHGDGFGVIEAVDEFASAINAKVRTGHNKTWFITK